MLIILIAIFDFTVTDKLPSFTTCVQIRSIIYEAFIPNEMGAGVAAAVAPAVLGGGGVPGGVVSIPLSSIIFL